MGGDVIILPYVFNCQCQQTTRFSYDERWHGRCYYAKRLSSAGPIAVTTDTHAVPEPGHGINPDRWHRNHDL